MLKVFYYNNLFKCLKNILFLNFYFIIKFIFFFSYIIDHYFNS